MNLAATHPPQGNHAPKGYGVCSQPESSSDGHVHRCIQSGAYENSGAKVRKIFETLIIKEVKRFRANRFLHIFINLFKLPPPILNIFNCRYESLCIKLLEYSVAVALSQYWTPDRRCCLSGEYCQACVYIHRNGNNSLQIVLVILGHRSVPDTSPR